MEATQRKKFVCKFCNKRFPCGKSLGGHIRIHLNGNGNLTTDVDQEETVKFSVSNNGGGGEQSKRESSETEAAAGVVGQSGYGLRENPKKTKRFVADSNNTNLLPQKLCKECGKGFQSLKALCGHMACHSKYNSSSLEDHLETSEKLKEDELVMDDQSDTETSAPSKGRRSRRLRYKTIGVYSSSLSLPNGGSLSSANSDVEQEQEEVAMSLMMLSRDSSFKGGFSFVADSSDNNSVVLEAKSSSTKMRINLKNGGKFVFSGEEFLEMKKTKQRELVAIENDPSDNSDSGYFRNGPKKVESDISVHGFNGNYEFKKHKMEYGSSPDQDSDAELRKRLSSFRRIKAQLGRNSIEEDGFDQVDRASMKYESRKRVKNESCISEFRSSNAQKRGKYSSIEGERISYKKTNGSSDSIYESGENSIDNDYIPSPLPSSNKQIRSSSQKSSIEQKSSANSVKKLASKRGKVYECPFCSKVFQSGQALGGHKRSHFIGVGEDRTMVINKDVPEMPMPALIDLNLPAPMEEDANGYMPW